MLKIKNNKIKLISAITAGIIMLFLTVSWSQKNSMLKNLNVRVNTEGDDYAPSLTADGLTAVFNSRMPEEKSHHIFICRNKNGLWGDPHPVFDANTDSNDETPFISADGNTIIFASDRPGGFSPPLTSDGKKRITFDLYISRLVNGKWSEPEILKGTVNTSMNERAPGLSADGKTLYFTRWPYNNPAKSKIYSAKLEDGGYADVKELPEIINSGNYEIGFRPSYKSDRYYFASRRPGGYGGWDIYYTTLTSKGFTKPVNAGDGINSPYDDMYYSESKVNSMICSDRPGGLGMFDLYSSVPAEKVATVQEKKNYKDYKDDKNPKQKTSATLQIKVIDNKNGKLIRNSRFRVLVMSERENESVFLRKLTVKSNKRGVFTLTPKRDVGSFVIEPVSRKYSGCSVKISVVPGEAQTLTLYLGKKSTVTKKNNPCADTETNRSVENGVTESSALPSIKNIYFRFNSTSISAEYIPELHRLVEFMRANPEYKIDISGYSDPAGSKRANERVSMKRAQNVADFIKSLDISGERMSVKWFGESKASSKKKGSRYHSLDRKVELVLEK